MALSVSRVLPLWRPSALDLDFLLPHPLSLSFSFAFSTLMTGADWRVSPQLAWATLGLVVFVHFSFSLCVCTLEWMLECDSNSRFFFQYRILKEEAGSCPITTLIPSQS